MKFPDHFEAHRTQKNNFFFINCFLHAKKTKRKTIKGQKRKKKKDSPKKILYF